MASKTITTTEYIDDLDGGKAERTVSFSYDGTAFEIDLSKKNRTAMEKALKPYLDAARRVRPARRNSRTARTSSTGTRPDLTGIREWATANGHTVNSRGRIPATVIAAYNAAH